MAREYERAREWLGYIDMSSRENWNNVGLALYGTFGDDGFELWDEASKRFPEKYNKSRTQEAQWADFKRKNPAPGIGLLRLLAVKGGWNPGAQGNGVRRNEDAAQEPDDCDTADLPDISIAAGLDGYAPPFSEEGMALSFAAEYADRLRYVKGWNAWMYWNGACWAREDTLLVYDLIRKHCRVATAALLSAANIPAEKKGGITNALGKAKTRSSIEILSKADRRMAATTDQWDADDWILNTPGGVIDLRTGKNLGPNPAKYCTKVTGAAPGGDCPLWMKFLVEVTGGDAELQGLFQNPSGWQLRRTSSIPLFG